VAGACGVRQREAEVAEQAALAPLDDRSLARVVGLGARDADTDAIELLERREIHRPSG
jgi:hypothetical protein